MPAGKVLRTGITEVQINHIGILITIGKAARYALITERYGAHVRTCIVRILGIAHIIIEQSRHTVVMIKYAVVVERALKVVLSVLAGALSKRCSLAGYAQNGVQRAVSVAAYGLIKCYNRC